MSIAFPREHLAARINVIIIEFFSLTRSLFAVYIIIIIIFDDYETRLYYWFGTWKGLLFISFFDMCVYVCVCVRT